MFFDLQTGGSISFYLNEALVQIREDTTCYDWGFVAITDNMICAGSYSGYIGPCYVRIFYPNKYVCEIFIFKSNTKNFIIISVRAV